MDVEESAKEEIVGVHSEGFALVTKLKGLSRSFQAHWCLRLLSGSFLLETLTYFVTLKMVPAFVGVFLVISVQYVFISIIIVMVLGCLIFDPRKAVVLYARHPIFINALRKLRLSNFRQI